MNKYKYLFSFVYPAIVWLSIYKGGVFAFLPILFMFVLVPVAEALMKPDKYNLTDAEIAFNKDHVFYDTLLYIHVVIYFAITGYFIFSIGKYKDPLEYAAIIAGVGILNGACIINLGHEFCHRKGRMNQYISEGLLLMSLETHFRPYHLRCHHIHVATPGDAATARRGEWIYTFVFREQITSYIQAWNAEVKRAQSLHKNPYSFSNRMVVYFIAQAGVLIAIGGFLGGRTLFAFFMASVIGMFTLACASYVEHYGILRRKKSNGKYEPVKECHAWNSDHVLSRLILFELSRHADHHISPNKKFQVLDSPMGTPQLVAGYPGSMLLSFIPPLWFKVMDRQLDSFQQQYNYHLEPRPSVNEYIPA